MNSTKASYPNPFLWVPSSYNQEPRWKATRREKITGGREENRGQHFDRATAVIQTHPRRNRA
jgi:hypothetical protein